jgi:hypothetical protein
MALAFKGDCHLPAPRGGGGSCCPRCAFRAQGHPIYISVPRPSPLTPRRCRRPAPAAATSSCATARRASAQLAPAPRLARSRQTTVAVRAERSSDSSFVSGFILGGIVCGGLAFLFAPQVRATARRAA